MTCEGCQRKVESLLQSVPGVQKVNASSMQHVTIEMNNHIITGTLKNALSQYPKYQLFDENEKVSSFWADNSIWKRAGKNTLNCLIGCSIGDFGMIIYLQTYHHHMNMFLMMALAMIAGLTTSVILETILLKINEKFDWFLAFKTAFGMSFLSMLAMELAENATDFMLTGGQVSTTEPFYWIALAISMVAGFVVPLPYNYYKLKKHGKACH
jgi:cation transport ATPase